MSRSSSKISRGNTSDLIGMFNNMSDDQQQPSQDPHHLTPTAHSRSGGGSSLGLDTITSTSSVRTRSLSPLPLQLRLSSNLAANNGSTMIHHDNSLSPSPTTLSPSSSLHSRHRKVSAFVTSLTPPPPITIDEARNRKSSAMPGLMPTKSALKSKRFNITDRI